ncbi:VPA1269 family protein [uncultured Sulfitobacter sp.]|uniref:VPA1269 family protein n=1 Tax=uncultured Sulfitobacter sp. TaxID=191468 RepID=UPI0030DD0FA5
MDEQDFLTTQSGRYYINISDKIVARSDLSWEHIFKSLRESEEIWRQWLLEGLITPFNEHISAPFSGYRASKDNKSSDPTFLLKSEYGGATKYRFLIRTAIYLEWMQRNGYVEGTFSGRPRTKFGRDFDLDQTLRSLRKPDVENMWRSILIDKDTRISVGSTYLESSLRYHVEYILNLAQKSVNSEAPLDFLNRVFQKFIPLSGKDQVNGTSAFRREVRLSVLRFLVFLSNDKVVKLSAPTIAQNAHELSGVFKGFVKIFATRKLARERHAEIEAGMAYLAVHYNGDRQLRLADFFIYFCAANYGSSDDFAPEFLSLVQTATAGQSNNIRPYFNGIREHYQVPHDEYRKWDSILKGRNSRSVLEGPFSMFRLQARLTTAALPVQVKNFEKRTGIKFPSKFDPGILRWVDDLERYIRKLPRRGLASIYASSTQWLYYLCTLSTAERPGSFAEVVRENHIKSVKRRNTYESFLIRNNLKPGERLRDLYQVMEVWQTEHPEVLYLPISPKLDWSNASKSFRTKRKAIPTLIIQTLIEENARECAKGLPYAMYRDWISIRQSGSSVMRIDGERPEEKIPSVPASIDCILHLGMRSSSARWLDSGEGDEFGIDYDSVKEVPNTSAQAQSGEQNGFLQRMQVGPTQWVPSILMLRNKTVAVHEIPYAPKDLVHRLLTIRSLQESYNPIKGPIRAVEDETLTNNLEDVALVFPLFRDPSNSQDKPVSYVKLTRWWDELLRSCEPIVHQKRKEAIGYDCEYYHFFDSDEKPLWDIHSIRVTVVTALLEMGVSPTIVQHLVGHKSPAMTLHYEAIENSKVSSTLAQALEARRLAAAESIGNAASVEELEDAIENVLGGLAVSVSGSGFSEAANYAISNGKRLKNGRSAFSVFSHGVCPGGDCAQGGVKRGNTHLPVHRDMACSRCRFRITGPAFLAGLELNANILMNEIAESSRKEERLNEELLGLSRVGKPTAILESRVAKEQEYRDEVWADWAAEYKTIRECLDLAKTSNGDNLPATLGGVSMHISELSPLPMLQNIIGKSKVIAGAAIDIPPGLVQVRNEMIWEIASSSGDIAKHLISLNKDDRAVAIHEFGDLVCRYSESLGVEPENIVHEQSTLLQLEQLWASDQEDGER